MRVLYWTESFFPRIGGSEVAAAVLLDELRRRGHEFEVVTRQWSPEQPGTDVWNGVAVHRVPFDDGTLARSDMDEILTLRQRVAVIKRRFRPNLIHIGLTGPSLFLHLFTAGQRATPTIVNLHVAPVESEYGANSPVREVLRTTNRLVPVSHAMASEIQRRLPEVTGRCTVIHNALPESTAPLTPVSFAPPAFFAWAGSRDKRGFDTAVAAMPRVREAFPDTELVIAGDGDATQPLEELARRLKLSECVRMSGWTRPEDVPALIDSATLVLMPSRWEPFGLVALQAGQRGRVCLASQVDGLPEVVQHEQTGLLLPPDQPDAWAKAIADCSASVPASGC